MGNGTGQRPLSEVSPMAHRRNSPSWNQSTKTMNGDSSPLNASPYTTSASSRRFWQGRDSGSPFQKNAENRSPYDPEVAYSPSKRASLENLKRVSRVRNSHMFTLQNQEYDPAHASVPQRPLSAGRSSFQRQGQNNHTEDAKTRQQHAASQQATTTQAAGQTMSRPPSPSKDQVSPAKSSLSKGSRFGPKGSSFDPEYEIWSDADGGYRHAKSVTFDNAPPQVNEYEMTTPDPSSIASESREGSYDSEEDEGDISFDRESSMDRDDSFDASLEDIEKTPVVLPEDWRFMSPDSANDELVREEDDPFTEHVESHSSDGRPSSRHGPSMQHARVESLDSNGERRPLPPLPSTMRPSFSPLATSPGKLSAAFELGSGGQRNLPPPPGPASFTKSDIGDFGGASMSLEDRLRLMMLRESENEDQLSESGEQAEKKTEEHGADNVTGAEQAEKASKGATAADQAHDEDLSKDFFSPPRISRDSILRDIRKSDSFLDDSDDSFPQIDSSPSQYMNYDPDIAIPSLELDNDDMENSVVIKEEDHGADLYDIPDYYDHISDKDSFKNDDHKTTDDDESQYSRNSTEEYHPQSADTSASDDGQATPVPQIQAEKSHEEQPNGEDQGEPDLAEVPALDMASIRKSLQRPATPEAKNDDKADEEPSTPESVIRHPIEDDYFEGDESVPDPIATVKAPGGALKTRPSLTPADMETMAATRRKISGQQPPMSFLTKQRSNESDHSANEEPSDESLENPGGLPTLASPAKDVSQRQSSLVKLDIPFSIQEESLGFGLEKEFDRVVEAQKVAFELSLYQSQHSSQETQGSANTSNYGQFSPGTYANNSIPQQRGYLMRHNTKVIIASSRNDDDPTASNEETPADMRGTRSAGSSPRKASQQTWTTVPWNGQTRRASIKVPSGIPKRKSLAGPAPPLPGQPSNVQEGPAPVEETEPALTETFEEGEERGRLFVKVVGLKYLDLPLPKGERSYFALTLDNGLHCVTTSWLELGKSAPIGQEFELIVQNNLEFQLTLQMKVDESKFRTPEPVVSSPTRQKASTFSRVFASPRRRKELDLKQQLASQQKKADPTPSVWDKLRTLIARDGSFARAYISLTEHEKQAFGRPYTVDIPCFNEWAVEEQPSSVKSKKSTSSINSQRRPPYKIGKLELQLLFVPKPKGAKDEDMPKSMNACIREMREAENVATRSWEGFLSQQGGDCPYWRRRFFKLQGSKLTAYHETTRQPRATINLAKAAKLIDDKSALTQKETTTKGGGRRKSAFAEEEEGYMFVEEGFRIRFGNGEVIDFYADSPAEKDGWMKVLADSVGKGSSSGNGPIKPWTELVLKRERSMKSKREAADRLLGSNPPPAPAQKEVEPSTASTAPAPQSPRPRHKHTFSQPEVRNAEARRQKTRSLIF